MLYKKNVFVFNGIAVIVAIAIVVHVPSPNVCVSRKSQTKRTNTQRDKALSPRIHLCGHRSHSKTENTVRSLVPAICD